MLGKDQYFTELYEQEEQKFLEEQEQQQREEEEKQADPGVAIDWAEYLLDPNR
jgi:hypothetical protein|tara:strand:- start:1572 stop:1730 length:159 start_codon:yes stop_codon:yes gene_type:complete